MTGDETVLEVPVVLRVRMRDGRRQGWVHPTPAEIDRAIAQHAEDQAAQRARDEADAESVRTVEALTARAAHADAALDACQRRIAELMSGADVARLTMEVQRLTGELTEECRRGDALRADLAEHERATARECLSGDDLQVKLDNAIHAARLWKTRALEESRLRVNDCREVARLRDEVGLAVDTVCAHRAAQMQRVEELRARVQDLEKHIGRSERDWRTCAYAEQQLAGGLYVLGEDGGKPQAPEWQERVFAQIDEEVNRG